MHAMMNKCIDYLVLFSVFLNYESNDPSHLLNTEENSFNCIYVEKWLSL